MASGLRIRETEAVEQEQLRPGMNVLTVAFGAGFTWGAMAMRW